MLNITIRTILFAALSFNPLSALAAPTKVLIFEAYTQDGVLNPNVTIAQHYTGSCWTRSLANPGRSDAWRCMSSNLILDPCFQDGTTLACLISPWSHTTAILELTSPIYKSPTRTINTSTAPPWALELGNGQHCTFLTGSSLTIGNVRINYTCNNSRYSVIGNVDRSSPIWKAKIYDFNNQSITDMPIVNAWF